MEKIDNKMPLKRKLEHIIADYAFSKMQGNGLLLLPLPTGAGKSYTVFKFIHAVADDAMLGRRKSRSDRPLCRACDGWEDRRQLLEAKICFRFQCWILSYNVVSQCGALYDK